MHVDTTRGRTRLDPNTHILVKDVSFLNKIDRKAALCVLKGNSAMLAYDVSDSNVIDIIDLDSTVVFEGTVPIAIVNSMAPPENIVLDSLVFVD